jgi:hypothetical protein
MLIIPKLCLQKFNDSRRSVRLPHPLDPSQMIIEALCEIEKPPLASVEGKVVAVVHSSAALMMALQNLATSLAWD